MDDFEPDPAATYTCPHCRQTVTTGTSAPNERFTCPHCGGDFVVLGPDEFAPVVNDEATDDDAPPPDRAREDELDGLRIRQLATVRRAAYRARSYAVIAFAVCQVGAVQFVMYAAAHARAAGWGRWAVIHAVLAVASQLAAVYFVRQAVALHREAKQSSLAEPKTTPDFEPLSDGSQRWDNLDRM